MNPQAVYFKEGRLYIGGEPVFLLSGELHYYRQPRENWLHLIQEAKAMGLNCVATYVPWLLHEELENQFDFTGNLDLSSFIRLCGENGLYVFIRPGPFIMAEMKNEGLPYWIAQKHPDAVPVGFHHEQRPCTTLDYLNPGYLQDCRRWYKRVFQEIVAHLASNGGPVIGVQLDNEVGMLNWVTNLPLLNDYTLSCFAGWLSEEYTAEQLQSRYPFSLAETDRFRSPEESWSHAFHLDYGRFMRRYYARYLTTLREYAEDCGVKGVPFFINVHGTGDARLYDFPLGLSQLYESYNAGDGMAAGSDLYLGEPKEGNFQDLYVANALAACMNKKGNPLTTIEFECSDGPYCSLEDSRFHPAAIAHSTLMSLMQNARLINYYIFNGGENYLLKHPADDGDGRMAFTGQLHGPNAPVDPLGHRNYSFEYAAKMAQAIHAVNSWFGSANQIHDPVVMGFVPDLFLTELCCPDSKTEQMIQQNLKKWRCAGTPVNSLTRALLDRNISFSAVDIQNEKIPAGCLLFFFSPRYLPKEIQQKLAEFVTGGGKLILYGEVPQFDLEGGRCTVLADALGVSDPVYLKKNPPVYYLGVDTGADFAGAAPTNRVDEAQCFPASQVSGILFPHGKSQLCCGFIAAPGRGKAAVISCGYPCDPGFYSRLFAEMGVSPSIRAPYWRRGIFFTRMGQPDGSQMLCLINLDYVDKHLPLTIDGQEIFSDYYLPQKGSVLLPLHFPAEGAVILRSTAELVGHTQDSLLFRGTQLQSDLVVFSPSDRIPLPGDGYSIQQTEEGYLVSFHQEMQPVSIRLS